jgi:hypothetical protein
MNLPAGGWPKASCGSQLSPLYLEVFIIGRDFQAERDIVNLNMTLQWFLCNVVQAIECWWIFQLNGDATFIFCSRIVDMISLGVNSLGAHNHTLPWSIIPKSNEGELVYTGNLKELRKL